MNKNVLWALIAALMLSISPAFAAGSISITGVTIPTSVSQGDAFNIIMSVSGSGVTGVSGSLTLPSAISCTPTGSQTISLGGGGSGSATWSCTASVSGDYSNRITAGVSATDSGTGGALSDSKQIGLSVLSPASLTASSVISSSSISTSGTATFTVGVNNVGDASTTYSITLGGCTGGISCSPTGVPTTSISGKSLANNQFTITGSSAGSYTVTATVSAPGQADMVTSQAITVTSSGGSSPGGSSPGGSSSSGGGGISVNTTNTTTANATGATTTPNEPASSKLSPGQTPQQPQNNPLQPAAQNNNLQTPGSQGNTLLIVAVVTILVIAAGYYFFKIKNISNK